MKSTLGILQGQTQLETAASVFLFRQCISRTTSLLPTYRAAAIFPRELSSVLSGRAALSSPGVDSACPPPISAQAPGRPSTEATEGATVTRAERVDVCPTGSPPGQRTAIITLIRMLHVTLRSYSVLLTPSNSQEFNVFLIIQSHVSILGARVGSPLAPRSRAFLRRWKAGRHLLPRPGPFSHL